MNTRASVAQLEGTKANSVAFNNDRKYFSVACDSGLAIFESESCELSLEQFLDGNLRLATMLETSQIVGIVMAEKSSVSGNRLILWDSTKKKQVGAIATVRQIRNIALTKTHIAVVFETMVVLYKHQPKIERVAEYDTASNEIGLCCLGKRVLIIPGRLAGQIQVVHIATQTISIIPAHTSALRALELSLDEDIVATASEKGTLIRLYSSSTCAHLGELRRGVTSAKIYSMAISPSSTRLAVTSDTNTLHVFELTNGANGGYQSFKGPSSSTEMAPAKTSLSRPSTPQGGFQKWGGFAKLPFAPRVFTDTYSFATATFDPGKDDGSSGLESACDGSDGMSGPLAAPTKGIAGWADDDTIIVISAGKDARYERFAIVDDNGNPVCVRVGWSRYLVPG